jgi:hypothetical protein
MSAAFSANSWRSEKQDSAFSEIFIKKQSGFDKVMDERLADLRDDWC